MAGRPGIYIGYLGHRNLGDEAIWEMCKAEFKEVEWSSWQLLGRQVDGERFLRRAVRHPGHLIDVLREEVRTFERVRTVYGNLRHKQAAKARGETAILGGGTLIDQSDVYLNIYRTVRTRVGRPIPLFGTGVADPGFWSTRRNWVDRRSQWASVLSDLPVVGVRGPMSKADLEEVGMKNVVIAGDSAIRFHTPPTPRPERGARPLRIGINGGDISPACWGTQEKVDVELTETTRRLLQDGCEIQFLSVCPEDTGPCMELAKRVGLDERSVVGPLVDHGAFIAAVRDLDCVVALKLHCGVLAAAANVPFVSLEYQPKCRDFALSLHWDRFVQRTDEVSADWILEAVRELTVDPSGRLALSKRASELSATFREYCDQIRPLMLE